MESPSPEIAPDTSDTSEPTDAADELLATQTPDTEAASSDPNNLENGIEKPAVAAPETYLDALVDRIQYANSLLSYFESLRMHALGSKVPKPYQKRWQYDSNLFFKMAYRAKVRYENGMISKKK